MSQIVNKKSVLEMAMGAIAEITDYEVERVVANIMDPNTAAKAKRKITITLTFTPDDYDDLEIAGVQARENATAPLIRRAVTTYCKANFGAPDEYDRLKAAYDEQKAQLMVATDYTNWGD